jgi:hypothetical protein
MNDLLSAPGRMYRYVDAEYGTIGLIVGGLMIAVAFVWVFIWIDRRK